MRRALFGLATSVLAASASAQTTDSTVAATALAVVRKSIPAGDRVLIGSPHSRRMDYVACAPRRPDSCRIIGGDAYLEVIRTAVDGGSATAIVALWQRQPHPHHPVSRRTYRFSLRRINGSWTVVGTPEMSTS